MFSASPEDIESLKLENEKISAQVKAIQAEAPIRAARLEASEKELNRLSVVEERMHNELRAAKEEVVRLKKQGSGSKELDDALLDIDKYQKMASSAQGSLAKAVKRASDIETASAKQMEAVKKKMEPLEKAKQDALVVVEQLRGELHVLRPKLAAKDEDVEEQRNAAVQASISWGRASKAKKEMEEELSGHRERAKEHQAVIDAFQEALVASKQKIKDAQAREEASAQEFALAMMQFKKDAKKDKLEEAEKHKVALKEALESAEAERMAAAKALETAATMAQSAAVSLSVETGTKRRIDDTL